MNNEFNFEKWWFNDNSKKSNGKIFSLGTKNAYFKSLKKTIPDFINRNIFEINNISELKKILDRLEYGDLKIKNQKSGNKTPSNALKQYIKFLENTTQLSSNNIKNNENRKVIIIKNNENKNKSSIAIKNIILYGQPGVGKTHNINKLINLIEEGKSEKKIFDLIRENVESNDTLDEELSKRVKFITFHQSFGYEDFIEGFRPNKKGKIKLEEGIFKIITLDAKEDKNKYYYLIIDEINRGNISKIFGELITLIEESKRDNLEVTLPYSKEPFRVPSNLFIIGTMNSTDKSIALIDIALRRRFTFLKMEPNEELVADIARDYFIKLNSKIEEKLGSDFKIGHSYFMDIKTQDDLEFVKSYKIKPLLEEYFYGDSESLKDILEQIQ